MNELRLRDSEPRVEVGRLQPVLLKDLLGSWGDRNRGSRRLDAPAQVAQLPFRGPLVRLPRVVREAARDLQQAELPPRGSDLSRVFVRAAERDPRLSTSVRDTVPRPSRVGRGSCFDGHAAKASLPDYLLERLRRHVRASPALSTHEGVNRLSR